MLKSIVFIIVVSLFCTTTLAQNYFYQKSFGTVNTELSRSIKLGADSAIYMVGYTNNTINTDFNIAISKLNYAGNVLWTKQLGDANYNAALYINTTNDGNFIICGENEPSANNKDAFVLKIDTAGNVIWQNDIALPNNQSLKYCEQTSSGAIIACGATNDSAGYNDSWVVKLTSNGTLIWAKSYGTTANEYGQQIKETPNGNYVLMGDVRNVNTNNSYDFELFKLDTAGTIIWDKTYGDDLQNGSQGVLITSANNYLTYGESEVTLNSPFNFWIDLVNPQGDTLWHKLIGGAYADAVFSATEVSDGFVFTGYSSSYNNGAATDIVVFKTDTLGNMLWHNTYGTAGIDIGYEIIKGLNNDFFVTGKYNAQADDNYLLHVNNNGTLLTASNSITKNNGAKPFPNPSTGVFYFNDDVLSVSVYNTLGQLVHTQNNIRSTAVNLSKLNNGIYTIKIMNTNNVVINYLISLDK
jgi:hypothetical protein